MTAMFHTLVAPLYSRLDYVNAVLIQLNKRRFESVLKAAVRLMYRLGYGDHITEALTVAFTGCEFPQGGVSSRLQGASDGAYKVQTTSQRETLEVEPLVRDVSLMCLIRWQ